MEFYRIYFLLMLVSVNFKAQTASENYVKVTTYLEPTTTSNSNIKQRQVVKYIDGLGKPKQIVDVKVSPLGNDIVRHFEYDQFGRAVKTFLPLPQLGSQNGNIYTSPDMSYYGGEKIYSENILENSLLDKLLSSYNEGNNWINKPIVYSYDLNEEDDEVINFNTSTIWEGKITRETLNASSYYPAHTLYKNKVVDEDGNTTVEFKNSRGQILLIRKILNSNEFVDTYYVYNKFDFLAFIIPPKAAQLNIPLTVLNELCYQYRYDGRGRIAEKKLPGKGSESLWESFIYDKCDRLVMNQDPNLKNSGKWLFTKYDDYGKVVYTGIVQDDRSREAIQQELLQARYCTELRDDVNGFVKSNTTINYTNRAYPYKNINDILTINYYDKYPLNAVAIPATILGQPTLKHSDGNYSRTTKSLLTATYVKNLENDQWTKNYIWYDEKGRSIGSHSFNHLGGYTIVNTLLDFAGIPQHSITTHQKDATTTSIPVTVKETFEYDSQNRLLVHKHQVDNNPEVVLTENTYDELSRIKSKKVGNNLQNIDYKYNIRGWLLGVNIDQMGEADLGGRLFSYKIKYDTVEGVVNPFGSPFSNHYVTPKYNGNIAEVDWRIITTIGDTPPLIPYRYGYAYDSLNRLKAGYYQNPIDPYSRENSEIIDYDVNGNITSLYRTSTIENANNQPTVIDDLTFTYAEGNKSNRLVSISDMGNSSGYEGGGGTIVYDANGNMIKMPDKNINSITYNILNLPTNVTIGSRFSAVNNAYVYRADGTKVMKNITTFNPGGTSTYYLDGFHHIEVNSGILEMDLTSPLKSAYEQQAFNVEDSDSNNLNPILDPTLQFFPTAEGFYDYRKSQYIYQYKDHLGNVRLSYGRDINGNLEIVDSNSYYPFGMNHLNSGTANFGTGSYKNYKYQEQELQETGFYAFKWRQYMPDVGRFFNIDPLSEKFPYNSTYAFSENRVIDGRELEGLEHVPINFNSYANSFVPYLKDSAKSAIKSIGNTAEKVANVLEDTGTYVKAGAIILGAGSVITGQPEGVATAVKMYNVGDKMSTAATVAKTTSLLSQGKVKDAAIGGAKEVVGGKVGDKINGLSKVNEVSKMVIKEGANNAIDKTATAIEKTVKPTENKPQKVVEDKKDPKN